MMYVRITCPLPPPPPQECQMREGAVHQRGPQHHPAKLPRQHPGGPGLKMCERRLQPGPGRTGPCLRQPWQPLCWRKGRNIGEERGEGRTSWCTDILTESHIPLFVCLFVCFQTCIEFQCVNASALLPGLDCDAKTTCHSQGVGRVLLRLLTSPVNNDDDDNNN